MTNWSGQGAALREERRTRRAWRIAFALLSCVVVALVASILMVPGLGMTQEDASLDVVAAPNAQDESVVALADADDAADAAADAEVASEPEDDSNSGEDEPAPAADDASPAPPASNDESGSDGARDPAAEDADEQDEDDDEADVDANVFMPAQTFEEVLKDDKGEVLLKVNVDAPAGAFPAGTTMRVTKLPAKDVREQVETAIETANIEGSILRMTAIDIVFCDEAGNEIEPATKVEVKITSDTVRQMQDPLLVHVNDREKANQAGKEADAEVVQEVEVVNEDENDESTGSEDTLKFESDEFSPYVIVETTIEANVLASDGHNFRISVTYGPDAQIPEDAELAVSELDGADSRDYLARTAATMDANGFDYARVFDISIVDGAGQEVQPAAYVGVSVELLDVGDSAQRDFSVVHFGDEADEPEQMDAETDGNVVSFSTDGFSAYAIVDGPDHTPADWVQIRTLADLREYASQGLYLGTTSGYFMKDVAVIGSKDANTTGIEKTTPASDLPPETAVLYYFEQVEGTDNQFYIYCEVDGQRQYVYSTGEDQNLTFTPDAQTPFTVTVTNDARFRVYYGNRYWNMWNGAGGNHIAAYTTAGDANNYFNFWWHDDSFASDPYDLDGKTYGLMNWTEGTVGKALMADSSNANALDALPLTVMAKAGNNNDKLFLPDNSDITMWTFEWVSGDHYNLKAEVDGVTKYLKIQSSGLTMVDTAEEAGTVQVVPGSGATAGSICLKSGNATLTYTGNADSGFKTGGGAGSEWLHLAVISELTDDYFMTYSASKVGVSDPSVVDGSRIIVYTRVWNDEAKKYEFFAIDHDGSLVPCYESGDSIQWVGSRLNSLLWNFVEYYWEGTTDPNYYYELYNQYSEKYIAPQVSDGQILSDDTIGINLNGRRDGAYYSTILAWDEDNYSYVGLKADPETGTIVSCPKSEAEDFYFAIMQDVPVDDHINTVPTVDNNQYGIKMKIIDFPNRATMSSFLGSDDVPGSHDGYRKGNTEDNLLSTSLDENGYPITAANNSLKDWFDNATEVNHLFIGSTHSATGYYEYDSTENFAHLDGENFKVYKQIGTMNSGTDRFMRHGQFMPFNDITAGVFASTYPKNTTDPLGNPLPEDDPRKYEQLYLVQNPNHYFGMELEASFTQTTNGLDDWGHDIIYEFTGDDDFWLYVDGELVLDLGGIHDALPGSVNFRTGDVNVNGHPTTLRDIFYQNYIGRGMSEAEALAKIDELFEESDEFEGKYIFKPYTTHTMRIFYFERGAGASNLHMRFNLASVRPGTVQLKKELGGVEATESVLAEFPYQIIYTMGESTTEHYLTNEVPNDPMRTQDYVFHKDTTTPVAYRTSLDIGGVIYNDVFMLKPDEVAEISFPEGVSSYRIVECGVNTDVYSSVVANGVELEGTSGAGYRENREDFGIDYATTDDRARVTFANNVDPDAVRTLTFTKTLYDESGEQEISADEDPSTFSFRLFLATEFDGDIDESPANMHTYHVKDPDGNYCRWDVTQQRLVPMDGVTDFTQMTDEQRVAASFTTSINGAIARIPIGYTVEVRDVLAGTQFKVVERPWEVPDGYSFQKYLYEGEEYYGYDNAVAGIEDIVVPKKDPHVDIFNLKGWGLRVNKVWTDAIYMTDRDATYFAVFTDDGEGPVVVPDTVRQMPYGQNTLYWYFLPLPVPGMSFNQYQIYEVEVTNPTVDDEGNVTAYDAIHIVDDGDTVSLDGKQRGETQTASFPYTVQYNRGDLSPSSNVRVDTVTNDRPGIVVEKQDWNGQPLPGATFTLKEGDNLIGTFTSDSEGRVTVAFLGEGKPYTLTETKAPHGYRGLQDSLTINVDEGAVSVSGSSADSGYYVAEQEPDQPATLIIRNRPFQLKVVKVGEKSDGTTEFLGDVPFELHREVTIDNVKSMELDPLPGFEDIHSEQGTGILPNVDETLTARTYYLIEKEAADGYLEQHDPIKFTIDDLGAVTLESTAHAELTTEQVDNGPLVHTITVKNTQAAAHLRIIKVDQSGQPLEGATFTFAGGGISETTTSTIHDGDDYALVNEKSELPLGTYTLTETGTPAGYNSLAGPVEIKVETRDGGVVVSASMNGTAIPYPDVAKDLDTGIWTVKISNSSGVELPQTGGPGTGLVTGLGLVLIAGACLVLLRRRRPALMR